MRIDLRVFSTPSAALSSVELCDVSRKLVRTYDSTKCVDRPIEQCLAFTIFSFEATMSTIPIDILLHILEHVNKADLRNICLLNKVCCSY